MLNDGNDNKWWRFTMIYSIFNDDIKMFNHSSIRVEVCPVIYSMKPSLLSAISANLESSRFNAN